MLYISRTALKQNKNFYNFIFKSVYNVIIFFFDKKQFDSINYSNRPFIWMIKY